MPSLLASVRNRLAGAAERVALDHAPALPADCPISWAPSVFTPVFYGHRDYTVRLPIVPDVVTTALAPGPADQLPALTVRCRVFFPSLDGSPADAPILRSCGKCPLVLFAHGHCGSPTGQPDHFLRWHLHAEVLARCGNVVVLPELLATGSGIPPSGNDEEVELLRRLIGWMRTDWEYRDVLMGEPATGLAGHSFGASLVGRLVVEGKARVTAHAALSGTEYPGDLARSSIPKLLTWGDIGTGENLTVQISEWETRVSAPAHVVEFPSGHWDYLPRAGTTCAGEERRGACRLVPVLSADVLALFFARYLPPEKWAGVGSPSWLPSWFPVLWFRVPISLRPPPLILSTEQKFFAGGHFGSWSLLGERPECRFTLNWKTSQSTGSRQMG